MLLEHGVVNCGVRGTISLSWLAARMSQTRRLEGKGLFSSFLLDDQDNLVENLTADFEVAESEHAHCEMGEIEDLKSEVTLEAAPESKTCVLATGATCGAAGRGLGLLCGSCCIARFDVVIL